MDPIEKNMSSVNRIQYGLSGDKGQGYHKDWLHVMLI